MAKQQYYLVDRAKRERAAIAAKANNTDVLVEYDRLGGLIRDSKGKDVSGTFYKKGQPKKVAAKKAVKKVAKKRSAPKSRK